MFEHPELRQIETLINTRVSQLETFISNQTKELLQHMATLQEDVDRLTSDLSAQTTIIGQISTTLTGNTQAIADLKAEVAALQSQGVDTTALEAQLSVLEGNNTTLQGLVPAPPATPATTS